MHVRDVGSDIGDSHRLFLNGFQGGHSHARRLKAVAIHVSFRWLANLP